MRQTDLGKLLPHLLSMARNAGIAIMDIYKGSENDMQLKVDQSPVTAADMAAHQCLVTALQGLVPDCQVVSEEDADSHAYRNCSGCFWLIDPLDGTKEFITRNGEFTVNIALINQSRSVLGVVYAPAIDCMYWGGSMLGAYRLRANYTEPIRVQPSASSEGICRVIASKSHLNSETQSFVDRLGRVDLVQAGSSLKFCKVSEGVADIYPRLAPTYEWDTAAAQAVLEGAGGYVVDLNGDPLRYGKSSLLNPFFIATRDITLIPS